MAAISRTRSTSSLIRMRKPFFQDQYESDISTECYTIIMQNLYISMKEMTYHEKDDPVFTINVHPSDNQHSSILCRNNSHLLPEEKKHR